VTSRDKLAGASIAAPGTLHHPGRDEHAWLDGKTSGDASHDEYHQASPEQPGPAGRVGETAAEQ